MFSYNVYQFLTVDHEVCQLSPNSGAIVDGNEIYSPPTLDTFLFVGGYLYSKSSHTFHQINHDFRKKYVENTREKPPSLRVGFDLWFRTMFQGCIAEISIDGTSENLDEVFKMQVGEVAKDGQGSLFSMKVVG